MYSVLPRCLPRISWGLDVNCAHSKLFLYQTHANAMSKRYRSP